MATSSNFGEEKREKMDKIIEDSPNDLSFLPLVQNGTFLNDGNYNFENGINSPISGHEPPFDLFPNLTDTEEDEFSNIFYIVSPTNDLEEAGPSHLLFEKLETVDEEKEVGPTKKARKELSLYEETLLKEFSAEIRKEQKLLQEEHEMRMKLWDLELQANEQQHALKMAILKEKLEKLQQEKENLQQERNAKYLGKFRSGPI